MNIYFILVEPFVPENIGASARAIKTMGFSRLRIVNSDKYNHENAYKLAYASQDIIENVEVFSNLLDALTDMDFVVGTSSKRRRLKYDYYPCSELTKFFLNKNESVSNIALVFGREDKGLKNSEIKLCDIISTIPMKNSYPSLNLAQAVMIFAYSLSSFSFNKINTDTISTHSSETQLNLLKKNIALLLQKLGFSIKSSIYQRILERLGALSSSDTHLFYSVYKKISKKV